MSTQLGNIALRDDYFVSCHLYPNVDLYIGLIYRLLGSRSLDVCPPPLFALGRIPGRIEQYREMLVDPLTKIGRPRQVHIGEGERDYVPMDQR